MPRRKLAWTSSPRGFPGSTLAGAARMSSNFNGMEWFAGTLRAWHLAVLRYAVTLDSADRLAVLRIAREIDGLYPRRTAAPSSSFFAARALSFARRSCNRMNAPPRSCDNILSGLTMTASSGPSRPARRRNDLWKGLSSRSDH